MEFDFFDEVVFPVIVTNYNGDIQYLNNALSIFLGRSPRQLQKEGNIKKIFPELENQIESLIVNSKEKIAISEEFDIKTEREVKTCVLRCRHKNVFIVFHIQDLTVEKRLYQKYRSKMDEMQLGHHELVQAGKVKAIGELAAMIAHEINNPLTIALGNAELLKFALEDSKRLSKKELGPILDNTHEALERMKSVVSSMRSFVLEKEVQRRYVDLSLSLKKCVGFIQRAFDDAGIGLEFESQQDSAIALVEENKIEQVIINLLQNSLDACREAIKKGLSGSKKVRLLLSMDEDGQEYQIRVEDNGIGVDTGIQSAIFQTFYSTKGEEGTGLGLTIAQKILDAHQGTLELESSQVNKGSVFKVTLPGPELASLANSERLYETGESCGLLVVSDLPEIFNSILEETKDLDCIVIFTGLNNINAQFLCNYPIDYVLVLQKKLTPQDIAKIKNISAHKSVKIFEGSDKKQASDPEFQLIELARDKNEKKIIAQIKQMIGERK